MLRLLYKCILHYVSLSNFSISFNDTRNDSRCIDNRWQQALTGEQKIFCNLILSGLVKSCVLLYGRNFEQNLLNNISLVTVLVNRAFEVAHFVFTSNFTDRRCIRCEKIAPL